MWRRRSAWSSPQRTTALQVVLGTGEVALRAGYHTAYSHSVLETIARLVDFHGRREARPFGAVDHPRSTSRGAFGCGSRHPADVTCLQPGRGAAHDSD